jgi:uncharacterized protein (DUF2164 family)|tara:strand:- start:23 stop:289 length:267 start_codon:yes stop_codon:yes gene_type:complete
MSGDMTEIDFTKAEKEVLARKIQLYFNEELNQELGQFDAQFMLDFFSETFGSYYYNRGLFDAQALFQSRIEAVGEAIYELEKPTEFIR